MIKPSAQKIKIATALDNLYTSRTCSSYIIHGCATCRVLITLMVNFSRALVIPLSSGIKLGQPKIENIL
jgi:hypothetical protein